MRSALLCLLSAVPAIAQPVPESFHRDSTGETTICGLRGTTVGDFERQVTASPDVDEFGATGSFRTYSRGEPVQLWSFTVAEHAAHPALVCRTPTLRADGRVTLNMEVRCAASRAACDGLYREFEELNRRLLARAAGGTDQ